jgi:hypothetical protein
MSPDWAGKAAAIPYSDLSDPQSFNLYAYVRNNPLVRTDADGHFQADGIMGVGRTNPDFLKFYLKSSTGSSGNLAPMSAVINFNAGQQQEAEPEGEEGREETPESEAALQPLKPGERVGPPPGSFLPGKGPLDPKEAKNFQWYLPWKTPKDEVFYRQWGGKALQQGGESGTYYSFFPPEGSTDFMRDQMSLPQEWGNNMRNTSAVTIPSGTTVYIGPTAPVGTHSGGGIQVFVPH